MATMNTLKVGQRVLVIKALVEGNSLRATARLTGVARMTVEKLLRDLSAECIRYQDKHLRNLKCRRVQCDEIWSFTYARQKNVSPNGPEQFGCGDVWTLVAIDADSKLAASWLVGDRSAANAFKLMDDLASRLSHRIQLTTDGHGVFLDTVESTFGTGIDYSMLVKIYGAHRDKDPTDGPADYLGRRSVPIIGNPDPKDISTSFVDRQKPTMRISMRRFTRPTNGFSKKVENHMQSVALHFMYYNFVRIRRTLRETPAMRAGITDKIWEVEDMVALL